MNKNYANKSSSSLVNINLLMISLISILIGACAISAKSVKQAELLSRDLALWQNVYDYGEVKLVGSELHLISSKNWFLITNKRYTDFILEAEVKMPNVSEYTNSGIIFRGQVKTTSEGQQAYGYQAEVDPSMRRWSGGLYDQGRRQWLHPIHKTRSFSDADFKQNYLPEWLEVQSNAYKQQQWNSYRIVAKGSDIKIYLNDVLTTHVSDVKDAEGYIGIQHHGSQSFVKSGDRTNTIRFRNISITELQL